MWIPCGLYVHNLFIQSVTKEYLFPFLFIILLLLPLWHASCSWLINKLYLRKSLLVENVKFRRVQHSDFIMYVKNQHFGFNARSALHKQQLKRFKKLSQRYMLSLILNLNISVYFLYIKRTKVYFIIFQVHFELYSWIFLPIVKNQNHWILLAANIQQRTVSILDSMGGKNDKFIDLWR